MLELDSEIRLTAAAALAHPYLAQFADPSDEPDSEPYDQSFEDMELPTEKWKGSSYSPFFFFLISVVIQKKKTSCIKSAISC